MNAIKRQLTKSMDYIEDNIKKIMSVCQFVMGCIMLACALIGIIAHSIMGNITSILGYIVAFVCIYLIYQIFRISYIEMREEFKK